MGLGRLNPFHIVEDLTGVDLIGTARKITGGTAGAIENVAQTLGNTVESIVSDPKKLAAVGVMIAFPGAANAVGDFILGDALAVDSLVASGAMSASEAALAGTTALGSGSVTSAIVGQAAINAATNGGDVEQAVKAALIQQGLPAALKSDVMQSLNKDMVDVLGKYGAQATTQAGLAAIMGKDPVAAFVFSGASSAVDLVTKNIPGWDSLPEAAKKSINAGVLADLTGKDAATAAANSLVASAMRGAQTASFAQQKASTTLSDEQIKTAMDLGSNLDIGYFSPEATKIARAFDAANNTGVNLSTQQVQNLLQLAPDYDGQDTTSKQYVNSYVDAASQGFGSAREKEIWGNEGAQYGWPDAKTYLDAVKQGFRAQPYEQYLQQTQPAPTAGGVEQLAQTQSETITPPTQQLTQETTGGLDQLINAINNPETTSSYTGTNVADVSGGITGLPLDQPTDQDYEQLGVGLPTGLTDTTDQGGVDVEQPGIPSLINQNQTGNGYQQGEGAFPGTDASTVASDQTSSGIDNLLNFGQGEGAFAGTGAGTVASDQTTGGTGMDDYDLSGFEGIDMTGGQQDTYQASNQEEENISTIPIDAGQGEGAFPGTEPGTVASDQPGGDTGLTPSFWDRASQITGLSPTALKWLGAGLGATGLASLLGQQQKAPAPTPYTGPLSNIVYNPATYTPYTYKPYAGGGAVESMSNANAIGANTGFPMADIQRGAYATPYQQPISQNVVTGDQDTRVDPYTGAEMFASGGIANLGGYSDGGRLLRGPGDGVSDSIPAMIGNRQPARLADGEFVIPARIVSEIGNGSTDAGARKLYEMMDRVQAARRKTTGKGKFAANTKADKYLPT